MISLTCDNRNCRNPEKHRIRVIMSPHNLMRFFAAALVIAAIFGLLFTKSFGPGHTVHKQTDRNETRQIANSVSARSLGSALRAIPSPSQQAPAAVPFSVRTPAHVAVYTDAEYGYTIATPPEVGVDPIFETAS